MVAAAAAAASTNVLYLPSICALLQLAPLPLLQKICAAQSLHMVAQLAALLPVRRRKQDDLSC